MEKKLTDKKSWLVACKKCIENKDICDDERFAECQHVCEAIDRLAELEDKIEQGKMIELPCKVGDDVYFVVQHEEDWVMEIGYVISISIDKEGIWIACRYSSGLSYWHNLKDSDVFFNANKANEKLKEQQNG